MSEVESKRGSTANKAEPIPALDGDVSNDGANTIAESRPYIASITIEGTTKILFHKWSVDGVKAKAEAAKGSTAKKTDDVESYVYRDEQGRLCVPGENLRMSIINAARYRQDPRSPRKSAMDLFKAAIQPLTELADLGVGQHWDFLDQRRVSVQRAGITRERPGLHAGWRANIDMMVTLPEYVAPALLREVVIDAGRLVGLCDFRPTFGRFSIAEFKVRE